MGYRVRLYISWVAVLVALRNPELVKSRQLAPFHDIIHGAVALSSSG